MATIKVKRSAVAGRIPATTDLELGEIAINTYDGVAYIKKNVSGTETVVSLGGNVELSQNLQNRYQYTATANQTTFAAVYLAPYVDVYLNGVRLLIGVEFTATNGTSIVLASGASAGNVVDIVAYTSYTANANFADLNSTHVTTALGFTPYNATNPSNFITQAQARDAISASGSLSYNSSTGVISYTTPTTSGITEGTNLYFTDARARAAISVTGAGSYNSTTGVITVTGGVTSVAGRTGAVTLTNADVGLGSVEDKSSATIRGEITSSNVTAALGFTPYNDTNPSSYITSAGARSAISATGSLSYNSTTGVLSYTAPTAVSAFTNDSGYLTANQSITVSGDATGSGASAISLTLANSGVTAGTYTKTTVDAKGRVTSGSTLSASDIPALDASKITTGVFDAARLPSYVDDVLEYANLAGFPASGETGKIYVALDTNKTYRWSGSAYVYITSGAVDSVAGKTGVVTLTNADVGLGLVENKSSATIRGEITSTNVTTALGFTPYNATNPSGYTNNTGTVTSVSGTGTVSGLTLTGSVTTTGSLTLGGTLSLTSANVTGALGFTPYNATNPAGYITSAALGSYLPLAGGTLTGKLKISLAGGTTPSNFFEINNTAAAAGNRAGMQLNTGPSWSTTIFTEQGAWWHAFGSDVGAVRWGYDGTDLKVGSNTVLHAGNYNNYSPSLTGSGANGTWNINITGSAATATDSTKLPLTGGTLTGQLVINTTGTANSPTLRLNTSSSGAFVHTQENLAANLTAGQHIISVIGKVGSTKNSGYIGYTWAGDASNSNFVTIGHWGNDDLLRVYGDGNVTVGTNTVLHAGNYNSYSPTLTGTGASGTWGISITGNAATATTATNQSGGTVNATTGTFSSTVAINGGSGLRVFADGGASITSHLYFANAANNRAYNWQLDESSNAALWGYGGSAWAKLLSVTSGGALNTVGAITQNGSQVLTAANFNSYALPLSGGTISGQLTIVPTLAWNASTPALNIGGTGDARLQVRHIWGKASNTAGADHLWINYQNTSNHVQIGDSGGGNNLYVAGNIFTNGYFGGNQVLNASNYNSYALPLSGGGLTGNLGVLRQRLTFSSTSSDANHSIYNNYNNIDGEGSFDGMKMNVFAGLRVRVGNASGAVPTQIFSLDSSGVRLGNGTSSPAGTAFSHTLAGVGTNRVVNFDGNGNGAPSVWWTSGSRAYGAIDAQDPGLTFWANNGSSWQKQITLNYGSVNIDTVLQQGGNQVLHAGNVSSYALPIGGGTLTGNLNIVGGRVTASSGGANTYGIFSGYDNNNHFIACRASVTGSVTSPSFVGSHQQTFVEYAEANDSTGWFFKSSQPGTYTEVARITRSQINWNGNTVLHAGNYTSYSPSLGGSGASGTWGISISGNASSATRLINLRNINGTGFDGTANIDTTEWFHSDRDFPNGTLITTNINYAVTYGEPFVLEIRGNSYGNIVPLDLQYQGYIYSDTIINHGGLSNGLMISGLVALNVGGNLCFWFPTQGYWNGYNVKVYVAYATRATNRVTSITSTAKPSGTKEVALTANIRQSLNSGNYTSYALPLSGGTVTGNTTIGRDLYINGQAGGAFGNRLIVGNTSTSFTLQDTNQRPTVQLHGQYPVLSLNHTVTSNSNHGPTIQFTCNGTGNQFVIGTGGSGAQLDMGYSANTDWNPHNGIAGYSGTTFFRAMTNGYIGLGALGDWGALGSGDPAYHLHFKGANGSGTHAALFQNTGASNGSGFCFVNDSGGHSWGIVSEFRISGTAGTDRPSILFSHGYNSTTWSVGFGYADDQFRISQNHGHRNGDWGTERFRINTSGTAHFNGNVAVHAGNVNSYALPISGGTTTGVVNITGNGNTGSNNNVGLNVYSTGGNGANMAFHRAGYYAVNMGLDSDNVMRIGGWSAGANRWQLDMSGNGTYAGNVTAYSDERLKKDWAPVQTDFITQLAKVKSGTYTRIDSNERQAGVSAQDFQKLLPETVSEDNAGTLSLAYGNAALVSAVELAKEVIDLRAQVTELRALIITLINKDLS